MENQTKSPIQIMADALAEMTERAHEAERQRDAAKEDAQNWYENYLRKAAALNEAEEKLTTEIAAHKETMQQLMHALSPDRKGEG